MIYITSYDEILKTIKVAYGKLKSDVYYDNYNLFLREELAKFDSAVDFDNKLLSLAKSLYDSFEQKKTDDYLKELFNKIDYIILPKNINSQTKEKIEDDEPNYLTNTTNAKIEVDSVKFLFRGPIELYIVSVLWIMENVTTLNMFISPDSYANQVNIDSDNNNFSQSKYLFVPYFKKYQEWRDRGIKEAKYLIDNQNNALMVTFDIKDFFHSCTINFEELKKDLNQEKVFSYTDILLEIYNAYTKKIRAFYNIDTNIDEYLPILPIGLPSSGLIANWYLRDLDEDLKACFNPIYYGRYVDDIFIVLSNVTPQYNTDNNSTHSKILNWLDNKYFKSSKFLKLDDDIIKINDKKYKNLLFNKDKIKIFYIDAKWPHAILNKFITKIRENSSAFWFLPDEDDLKDILDDKAYEIEYVDSINKLRGVSEVKGSKFWAAIFLARRLKLAVLQGDKLDKRLKDEIFRFFKGSGIIEYFSLWEKVFTYFILTSDFESIKKLYKIIKEAIDSISNSPDLNNYTKKIQENLKIVLNICVALSFSFDPQKTNKLKKSIIFEESEIAEINNVIKSLRTSLLIRHSYLPITSIILSKYYHNPTNSLLKKDFYNYLNNVESKDKCLDFYNYLQDNSYKIPRWINLDEICMLKFLSEVSKFNENSNGLLFGCKYSNNEGESYFESCMDLFYQLNGIENKINVDSKVTQMPNEKNPEILIHELNLISNYESTRLKIGLSNIKVKIDELEAAIENKYNPKSSINLRHINLINDAEKEKLDLLILPETSVPLAWVSTYVEEARRKQRAFIFGIEYFTINKYCFNFSFAVLPMKLGGRNEAFLIPRLKNHYAPLEISSIKKLGIKIPILPFSKYHLITWKNLTFTIYNCYELADIVHRSLFRSQLDILFAIENNQDVNYFNNIAESTTRDLHCYFVQANTSNYGDTRIVEPKETHLMNPLRVKGGNNDVILTYELDIEKLRNYQKLRLPYSLNNKEFKPVPPGFVHEEVDKRGK